VPCGAGRESALHIYAVCTRGTENTIIFLYKSRNVYAMLGTVSWDFFEM